MSRKSLTTPVRIVTVANTHEHTVYLSVQSGDAFARALSRRWPLSDAWQLVLTKAFHFIRRLRGLCLRDFQRFVVFCPYIHRWMPLRKWEAVRHDATLGTVRTSSGQPGEGTFWRCTARQGSQSSSRPAGPRGSPAQPASTTRDTPRSTATVADPTLRGLGRGHPNWGRSAAPRRVSASVGRRAADHPCGPRTHSQH